MSDSAPISAPKAKESRCFPSLTPQNQPKVEMIELQPYKYVLSSAGHCNYVFTAPSNGSISLCWDNSYSYFTKQRFPRSLI